MQMTTHASRLIAATLLALTGATAAATPLFNAALGTLPSAQGWLTTAAGGPYQETAVPNGAYTFDTTSDRLTSAGSARFFQPQLDTANGFTLSFSLKVLSEWHTDDQRAGFSVLFNGLDPDHGLELAFRADQIWAYDADFTHRTSVAFDTTALTDYTLVVTNARYAFYGNGNTPLSGALAHYDNSASVVYSVPGLLFFGDDTTRAGAKVEIGQISLAPAAPQSVPEPGTLTLLVGGLAALVAARARRR